MLTLQFALLPCIWAETLSWRHKLCCLQQSLRHMQAKTKEWGEANKEWNLYIVNFFGCDFCNPYYSDEERAAHAEGLKVHFSHQSCTLQRYAHAAWLPKPHSKLHSTEKGC